MTVIVTGATGFIGSALALRLAREHRDVLCLVRDPARAARVLPGLETVCGDIRDRSLLADIVRRADTIYHCAGLTNARKLEEYLAVNAEATAGLAAAAAEAPTPPKIVLISSLAAAGPRTSDRPALEEDQPDPRSPYGVSKLRGEEFLRRAGQLRGMRWTVIRPPWVYGPGDRDTLTLFRMAARGRFPIVRGGRMEVSLIHVDDLVEALLLAGATAAADGRTYYATDGVVHTVAELGALLLGEAGGGRTIQVPAFAFRAAALAGEAAALFTRRPPQLGRHKAAEGLEDGWVCSDGRIRRELGYRSRVSLAEGVAGTFAWYRERGWL